MSQNNISVQIATAGSRTAKRWKNQTIEWGELVERLSTPVVTKETLQQFLLSKKDKQVAIKDVGGYVGGELLNGKRSPKSVLSRSLLTLDVDFATTDFFLDFCMFYQCAGLVHATHKHTAQEPRYRLIIPLDRPVSSEEYGAISRQVAGILGIELFDNTTFEVNRLMFWPSIPRDVEYYVETQEGPALCADDVLETYNDWTDSSEWPTAQKHEAELKGFATEQEEPRIKHGIVGAFCRTYSLTEAIAEFLPDVYVEGFEGRYTYLNGSTANGVVVYDDTFAYSHHGTDPTSGTLCNAFDLVRVHKFGHLDPDKNSKKSFNAMEEFCKEDEGVKRTLAQESVERVKAEFSDVEEIETDKDDSTEWMLELETTKTGTYKNTAVNIRLIFENDRYLKGLISFNQFNSKAELMRSAPWRRIASPEPIRNVDFAGVRQYIECAYGIASSAKIDDCLLLDMERNAFHPVREYLNGLEWDGVPRVETVLVDYFGAADNYYTRQAARKWFAGAVSRIFRPACKFDLVLVLVDKRQGTGKSTFFRKLGGSWFSDTFMGVNGKDALEQIQGAWIIEMAELAGLRKAEAEAIKHFITKQEDQFRAAYTKVSETHKRQCVFAGTTNDESFLSDPTGNRRFLPIKVQEGETKKSVFKDLDDEVGQLWAEAVYLVAEGEKLHLDAKAEALAKETQQQHTVDEDPRIGKIRSYLDMSLPENWGELDVYDRRAFIDNPEKGADVERLETCIAEVFEECLGGNLKDLTRAKSIEVGRLIASTGEWVRTNKSKRFGAYGPQKYFEKVV